MDIKECYRKMGGDFDDVMQRLGNESFIQRFVIRFLDGQKEYFKFKL